MERARKAYLYALSAVLFWATVATAFKLSLRFLSELELLFLSSAVSFFVLLAVVLVSRNRRQLLQWPAKEIARSAWIGFLNPFLYYVVLFRAYSLLPAQEAQTLNYLWPIVLTLLSIVVLRQKAGRIVWVSLLLGFVGACVIATRGDVTSLRFSNPEGAGLALFSTVIWASYWIANLRESKDKMIRLLWNFFFGSIYAGIALAFTEGFRIPDLQGIGGGVYVGVFEMGLTFVVWMKALENAGKAATAARLVYLAPFLSLMIIHFVLGEPIFPSTVVGLILILTGVLLPEFRKRGAASSSA